MKESIAAGIEDATKAIALTAYGIRARLLTRSMAAASTIIPRNHMKKGI